jgi:hypothetical protein
MSQGLTENLNLQIKAQDFSPPISYHSVTEKQERLGTGTTAATTTTGGSEQRNLPRAASCNSGNNQRAELKLSSSRGRKKRTKQSKAKQQRETEQEQGDRAHRNKCGRGY